VGSCGIGILPMVPGLPAHATLNRLCTHPLSESSACSPRWTAFGRQPLWPLTRSRQSEPYASSSRRGQIGLVWRNEHERHLGRRPLRSPPAKSPRRQIGFVLHDKPPLTALAAMPTPPRAVRAEIGFVFPGSCGCPIHHNSFPARCLPLLMPREKLALFGALVPRSVSTCNPGHQRPPVDPRQIGFVCHSSCQERPWRPCRPAPTAVQAEIGFVFPGPCGCPIYHNSLPERCLPLVTLWEKLALFRTTSSTHAPAPRYPRGAQVWLCFA
jgi:hypothetical protein